MAGTAAQQEEVHADDQVILSAEEARLLERLWAASNTAPFPLKGRPTKGEAWELAMTLLRMRLPDREFAVPPQNKESVKEFGAPAEDKAVAIFQ